MYANSAVAIDDSEISRGTRREAATMARARRAALCIRPSRESILPLRKHS